MKKKKKKRGENQRTEFQLLEQLTCTTADQVFDNARNHFHEEKLACLGSRAFEPTPRTNQAKVATVDAAPMRLSVHTQFMARHLFRAFSQLHLIRQRPACPRVAVGWLCFAEPPAKLRNAAIV